MKRLFLINLVILCSRIGLQNLTICPLPVFSTQNLRQKKNHSSALNENTYLFHQHFSKTKLHIIIYFWIILFHNHLEKSPQMKKKTKNWCQLCHKRLFNVSPSLRVAQIFYFFNSPTNWLFVQLLISIMFGINKKVFEVSKTFKNPLIVKNKT